MTTRKKPVPQTVDNSKTLNNCNFYGVHWDAKAVTVIQTLAEGLVTNAEALKSLAELLKSQNVNIECLLKVSSTDI